jgi:hypothetical protein
LKTSSWQRRTPWQREPWIEVFKSATLPNSESSTVELQANTLVLTNGDAAQCAGEHRKGTSAKTVLIGEGGVRIECLATAMPSSSRC